MLYLRTGLPGASKTLNTLKEIIEDKNNAGRPVYYNNIKLLMLDFEVCGSFAGWFYGIYWPELDVKKKPPLQKRLLKIHGEGELASLETFPHLEQLYNAWLGEKGDLMLWLYWVRLLYPVSRREELRLYLEFSEKDQITADSLKQFNLDFRRFDHPSRWYELPRNSIIVIDECQQTFPNRAVGSKVPQHCSEFETHRHKGWDIHLVTQDAKLLDNHVRRLAGTHVHYFNPFKSSRVTRYQGDKVFDQEDYFQKKNTISSVIARDKRYYGLYWSADAHTHKLVIPKKLLLALPIPFLVAFLAYYLISGSWLSNPVSVPVETSPNQANNSVTSHTSSSDSSSAYIPTDSPEPYTQIKPFSAVSADTPLGQLCETLTYAGYELTSRYGRYLPEHFFNCELPFNQEEAKNDENFVKPSLLLDGYYLSNLGFTFEYINRMPVLSYGNTRYIFPRY